MLTGKYVVSGCLAAILGVLAGPALAQQAAYGGGGGGCSSLPGWAALKSALTGSITAAKAMNGNGGLGFNMWGTIVDTSGVVCAVAFSGSSFTSQWLGSRVIAAQKANTGNAFSLGNGSTPSGSLFGTNGLALSSANLYTAVQPGGSLYGLQASNPVDTDVAYGNHSQEGQGNGPAPASTFGMPNDPLVGQRVGGINVFGGGLVLYQGGVRVGGLGVSGDTSCTDHMVAWRTRNALGLDKFGAVGSTNALTVTGDLNHPDNIIFDITVNTVGVGAIGVSTSGFGHPMCLNNPTATAVSLLPAVSH
jgi:Haem-degrading